MFQVEFVSLDSGSAAASAVGIHDNPVLLERVGLILCPQFASTSTEGLS
jgi:hypothetical protein